MKDDNMDWTKAAEKYGVNKIKEIEKQINKLCSNNGNCLTYAEVLYELGMIDEYEMGNMIERELLQGGRLQWGGSQKELHFDSMCFGYTVNEIIVLNKKGLYLGWTTDNQQPITIIFSDIESLKGE